MLRGGTPLDVAGLVHRDIAESLKCVHIRGVVYDSKQVWPDHAVSDGDLVELHA